MALMKVGAFFCVGLTIEAFDFFLAIRQGGEACLSEAIPLNSLEAVPSHMFGISKVNPAYYLTSVTKDRLPIFRTSALAKIACNANGEGRETGEASISALRDGKGAEVLYSEQRG